MGSGQVTSTENQGPVAPGESAKTSNNQNQTRAQELMEALIQELGGPHSTVEHLTAALEFRGADVGVGNSTAVCEDTPGHCYLKLFDRVEHRDALAMGLCPTVAELRRFSNGRVDPFGTRNVDVIIDCSSGERAAHIRYNSGNAGLRPVAALAALAKDCKVGYCDESREPNNNEVPADLPFNVPNADQYPYARYTGLVAFVTSVPYQVKWDFIVDLGGSANETPTAAFWAQSFETRVMLKAYFKLASVDRAAFLKWVYWVRDPVPGRPGGVQVVPPAWPHVLPSPVYHIMTRYAGLAEWVDGLTESWKEVARVSVFGIREPFDPTWWSDFHKTVDLYFLYARLSPHLRDTFSTSVTWIPESGDFNNRSAIGHHLRADFIPDGGHCYLDLIKPTHRSFAESVLGSNPLALGLANFLRMNPECWAEGRFSWAVHQDIAAGADGSLQGHVERSDHGLTVKELLGSLVGNVRVGATNDLNAMMGLQTQEKVAAVPTVFPASPSGGSNSLELNFNCFGLLGKAAPNTPAIFFDILKEPVFALLLGSFESVHLLEAHFDLELSTGAGNVLWAAITSSSKNVFTDADWYGAPVNLAVRGSDQGYVHAQFALPKVHPFEKELRDVSGVGNPPPTFRFAFAGAANSTAVVKGQFKVRVRGQTALGHLQIGAPTTGKSYKRHVKQVTSLIGGPAPGGTAAPSVAEEEEDDDEEESEDEEPTRASPIRANMGVARSPPK